MTKPLPGLTELLRQMTDTVLLPIGPWHREVVERAIYRLRVADAALAVKERRNETLRKENAELKRCIEQDNILRAAHRRESHK